METDDILQTARERFDRCVEAESENRKHFIDDLRFLDGDQWPEDIRASRENAGRPALVINRIPAYTRQVINDIRQLKSAIKVRGVDSKADPDTAEMLNGMIRAIEQDSGADAAYDWGGEYAVRAGFGYWRVDTDYESETGFDQVVKILRIKNPLSVYLDPDCENADGSDAKFGFVVEYRDKDALQEQYKVWDGDEWPVDDARFGDWYTKDKARVAEYWCIEEDEQEIHLLTDGTVVRGTVTDDFKAELAISGLGVQASRKTKNRRVIQRLITGSKILEQTEWLGKYIPIVRVLGEEIVIDGEQRLKGMVRDLKDPQMQYNFFRTASAERGALQGKNPYIGRRGAFRDPKWKRINNENYAYLEYDGDERPMRDPALELSTAFVSEVQQTSEEFKAVSGIYDPALGNQSTETSGVAINARKLESDVSNFHYVDNLARAKRYTGMILVDLIPKIYSTARAVNILHPDGEEEEVHLNQPYVDKEGRERNYNLAAGRYDAVVDIGPSYTTQREAAVDGMLEIARSFPESVSIIGDLIAKNMDWPEADEISKRLKTLVPPEVLKGENPQISRMLQMHEQEKQAGMQVIQSLQQQLAQYQQALQDRDRELAIKEAEVNRKREADMQGHIEGMTKLEIESGQDLGPEGVAN